MRIYHIFCPSVDGHLNCFQFLALMKEEGFDGRLGVMRIGCSGEQKGQKDCKTVQSLETGKL